MVHRKEGYGENKRSVLDALEDQGHRSRVVNDFERTVDKIKGDQKVSSLHIGLHVCDGITIKSLIWDAPNPQT